MHRLLGFRSGRDPRARMDVSFRPGPTGEALMYVCVICKRGFEIGGLHGLQRVFVFDLFFCHLYVYRIMNVTIRLGR